MFNIVQGIPKNKEGLGLVTYAQCSNGTFLIKAVGCGHVVTKVDGIPNLPEGKEEINILPRKIPANVFWETTKFFRKVEKEKFNGEALEAYVLVAYNKKEDKFFIYVPKQTVSSASAKYDIEEFWKIYPKDCYVVMDIHSHTSNMGAFFSGTDDRDDNRDRYSMVIGKINRIIPEFCIRFGTMGRFLEVEMSDVICDNEAEIDFDVEKSIDNIEIFSKKASKINNTGTSLVYSSPFEIPRSGYANIFKRFKRG